MHLSTVIAISGLLTTALGALSPEQLFVDIQNVQNMVSKADAYAENINAVNAVTDAEQIGTNNDNIANQLDNIQKSLEGSGQLSRDDEDKLIEAIDPFTDALATYFDDLANKAPDFLLPDHAATVKDSSDAVGNAADDLYDALIGIAPDVARALEPAELDIDESRDDLDEAYEEDFIVAVRKSKVKGKARRASAGKGMARRSNSMRLRY